MGDGKRHSLSAWTIAVSCFWVNIFIFPIFRCAGIFYVAFYETFNCSYEAASFPLAIAPGIASISGLPAGFLSHYLSIRTITSFGVTLASVSISICFIAKDINFIFVFLGIFQGIGVGFTVLLLPAIISQYFGAEKAIACGLSYAGVTIGSFFLPLLMEYLLDTFGLQGSLLIVGGIVSHALFGTLLLRPFQENAPQKVSGEEGDRLCLTTSSALIRNNLGEQVLEEKEDGEKMQANHTLLNDKNQDDISENQQLTKETESKENKTLLGHLAHDFRLLKNIRFALSLLVYNSYLFAYMIFNIIFQGFAVERGLTFHEAVLLTSFWSITDILGRLLPGWLSYKGIVTNRTLYVGSITALGLLLVLMPHFACGFSSFLLFILLLGFLIGCQMVLPPVIMSEYLGSENTAFAFGFANFVCGCLSPLRGVLIGYVKSTTGKYDGIFYITGSLAFFSGFAWILEPFFGNRKNRLAHTFSH